uniref:Endonuclease/exonuclease/phosphatase domain-containing protein n=1 Tax=Anguilla anguilla TaxID=7936 RepID=A0A0E9VN72_ANGAN
MNAVAIPTPSSFECLVVKLSGPQPLYIAVIYRPPKPSAVFLSEFSSLLTTVCAMSSNVFVLGDFNIHIDSAECIWTSYPY